MVKYHEEYQDITSEEWNEIKDLYVRADHYLHGLSTEDDIRSVCNHISGYDLITDTYNEDVWTVSIGTDNREPNTLQGIRVYLDKETHELSRFIDVYFNDEEYPFEDIEIKTENTVSLTAGKTIEISEADIQNKIEAQVNLAKPQK